MSYRTTGTSTEDVLDYVRDFIDDNRVPPTTREIAAHFKTSPSFGSFHLQRLHDQGRITYRPKAASKALRVTLK